MVLGSKTRLQLLALGLCASAIPASVLASQERTADRPSFHTDAYDLLQLTVEEHKVAPKAFVKEAKAVRSCGDGYKLARTFDASIKRQRHIEGARLPTDLRAELKALPNGHASKVFRGEGGVLRVLLVCGRR